MIELAPQTIDKIQSMFQKRRKERGKSSSSKP